MRYVIITGEVSGDRIGAALVQSMKKIHPDSQFYAMGGVELKNTGTEIFEGIDGLSFMGFSNPLQKLLSIWKIYKNVQKNIKSINPDAIIHIDSAGFNLRLGKWAKGHGFTTIYIAPPKTWASRPKRNKDIKDNFDLIFTLFPFAREYFKHQGIATEFFGHPLMEDLSKKPQLKAIKKVLIAPGSRTQEVKAVMPILWKYMKAQEQYEFIISKVDHIDSSCYSYGKQDTNSIRLSKEPLTELLKETDFAIVTSGTATLEAAMLNIPQVIIYKTNWLNHKIAKTLINTDYIGLPNLLVDSHIVPELIQEKLTVQNLQNAIAQVLNNLDKLNAHYDEIRAHYTDKSSADTIANTIKVFLDTAQA